MSLMVVLLGMRGAMLLVSWVLRRVLLLFVGL